MTISTQQFTVTTARQMIVAAAPSAQRVTVHNNDAAQQVYIGGADVTTSNGLHVDGKEQKEQTLNPADTLYAIAAGSYAISVMIQKQD